MEFHPAANLFPMMREDELSDLASDIARHGLLHAIMLHEGKIIDGRNRFLACARVGVEPRFVDWVERDQLPTEWVLSENLHRRHLDESQRAAIGAQAMERLQDETSKRKQALCRDAALRQRGSQPNATAQNVTSPGFGSGDPNPGDVTKRPRTVIAERLGVAEAQVQRAKALMERAPDLFEEVKAGDKKVRTAYKEAQQRGVIESEKGHRVSAIPRPVPRTLPGGRLPAPQRGAPIPANTPPRVRDFVEAFEDRLSIALCQKHPGLTSAQWDDVVLMMRERMLSLFEGYSLGRKTVAGTVESSLRNGRK